MNTVGQRAQILPDDTRPRAIRLETDQGVKFGRVLGEVRAVGRVAALGDNVQAL